MGLVFDAGSTMIQVEMKQTKKRDSQPREISSGVSLRRWGCPRKTLEGAELGGIWALKEPEPGGPHSPREHGCRN